MVLLILMVEAAVELVERLVVFVLEATPEALGVGWPVAAVAAVEMAVEMAVGAMAMAASTAEAVMALETDVKRRVVAEVPTAVVAMEEAMVAMEAATAAKAAGGGSDAI